MAINKENARKAVGRTASFGLILVAVGLLAPFADLTQPSLLRFFKWVYAAGALIFTGARLSGVSGEGLSMRVKRLRRLEFWAGVAFCIGAFFWFYNEDRLSFYLNFGMGALACLRDTVYFTLAGAVIQILALVFMSRAESKDKSDNS